MNRLLYLSQACRDNKFPFWKNCNGTFGSHLYRAMKEKGINPESVFVDMDNETVNYKGKTRKIRKRTVNGIMEILERIDQFIKTRARK